jgi:hypothetical protein
MSIKFISYFDIHGNYLLLLLLLLIVTARGTVATAAA